MARSGKESGWAKVLKLIQTPLGFYVLALLIIESTLCIVLTAAGFERPYKWYGFLCMVGIFVFVLVIVSILVFFFPKNLVFGKEEHSAPQIEPSALRDQIEDIIFQRVKSDCLKPNQEGVT